MRSSSGVTLQKLVFQLFIFFLPTQLSLHFWPDWAFIYGIRVDYLAPAVYLTDLILVVLLALWIGKDGLSVFAKREFVLLFLFTIFLCIFNIYFAQLREASILKWAKVIEAMLLVYYVAYNKHFRESWVKTPLMLSILLVSAIAIAQFIPGGSVGGPLYYLGERTFRLSTPGISLVSVFGEEFLRPYSTFSHPNSLAGFLLVSSLLVARETKGGRRLLGYISLFVGAVAFVLASSLGAILALVVLGILYFLTRERMKTLSRLSHLLIFLSLLLSLVLPIAQPGKAFKGNLGESVERRLELARDTFYLVARNPLVGVGLNNFIPRISMLETPVTSWWLQPVHNIFLLVLVEGGFLGLAAFYFLINKGLEKASKEKRLLICLALLAIIITGLFDHYWLTLQQNFLLFSLTVGLSFRC